jgi:membrane-anchored protein YejM (alkaline phosphatase superfamily)
MIRDKLARPGPHFLFLFYFQTHYPYHHREEYNRFQPEIPANFGMTAPLYFQSWDAARHSDEIVNRYKNCLQEFDAWLQAVLQGLDLDKTIVVVTGDHGEELLETGRLLHCSALNEAQTRVP